MRNSNLIVSVAAAVGAVVAAGVASAADLPVRTYTKAPPPVVSPVYNWGGFYIGLNGGGGSAHDCWTYVANNVAPIGAFPAQAEGCHNATGGTVGGQVGYRWQATNWVFGLEAQGNWANFSGSNINQGLSFTPTGSQSDVTKLRAFGLFTGQVGYAINNVLIYAKGGAAVVRDDHSIVVANALGAFVPPAFFIGEPLGVGSETRWGGAVGAGIEFGFAPHWSVAVEYDHLFMGTHNVNLYNTPVLPAGFSVQQISQDVDIGTVRLNYTFGGPVVARY